MPVGYVPDLRESRVMVLPMQSFVGVRGPADEELGFALRERGEQVDWILPDEVRAALRRSPSLRADIEALPVGVFLRREVRRIGDPLYGEIRRAAAVTDASLALLPVQVRHRPESPEQSEALEVVAALIDVRSGRVLWFAILEGPGSASDPAALASAMEALARALTGG